MMHAIRITCGLLLLLAALVCLPSAAFANGTITAQLNYPPSNNILDGIYVGPYSATNLSGGGSLQMICDDFKDESNYSAATYTVNTISSLGNAIWASLPNATQLYEQAAWLALGMLQVTGTQQGYYSYALWAVFDPTDVLNWLKAYGDTGACNAIFGSGNNCNSTTVTGGLLQQAQLNYASGNYSNVLILTPNCSGALCQEQEFFLFAPEGGSALLYLLLSGASCLGAVWQSRRHTSGPARAA